MKYEEYLRNGQLSEALASLQEAVRDNPADSKLRISLFQLLAVMGQWQRAHKQLDVIHGLDDAALAMVHLYRAAIACEVFREAVFRGEREPIFLGEPENWQALMLQALKLTAQGQHAVAAQTRQQALEQAATSSGVLDGKPFSWLADADSRLGPTLELFLDGGYRWVSLLHIERLLLEEPVSLQDVVWLPAHITWRGGGESHVLIPSRYPYSATQSDPLALSRLTVWDELAEQEWQGFGQRIWVSDSDEYSLLDVREVHFDAVASEAGNAG